MIVVNSMDVTLGLYPRMQQFSQQKKLGVHGITNNSVNKGNLEYMVLLNLLFERLVSVKRVEVIKRR